MRPVPALVHRSVLRSTGTFGAVGMAGDPATLPAPLRRPAAWIGGIAAGGVAVLAVHTHGLGTATRTDDVLRWLVSERVPEEVRSFWLVQSLGNPLAVVVLAGLLAALALATGRRRLAVLAAVGPGLTGLVTTGLKPVVDRTLDGELAYPSGHTGGFTALAVVAGLLLVSLLRTEALTGALVVAVAAVGAGSAMAVALTALDIHYPTDTIGGFGTALAVVLGTALLLDAVAERWVGRRRS